MLDMEIIYVFVPPSPPHPPVVVHLSPKASAYSQIRKKIFELKSPGGVFCKDNKGAG